MLPGPMLIEVLDRRFGNAWLSHEGQQINVSCPFCPHRGYGTDESGHLGLHFGKGGGVYNCVRCGAGGKGLAAFLDKNGVPAALYTLSSFTMEDLRKSKNLVRRPPAYAGPVLEKMPPVRRLVRDDFDTPTVWGKSMIKKNVSFQECDDYAVLCGIGGEVRDYVVFPFFESLDDETPVYWQGRDATGEKFLRKVNPSVEECPQGKNHWLYGFEFAKREAEIYLVEGTLDVISLQTWLHANRGEGHYALGIQGTILSFPGDDVHPLNSQYGKLTSLKPSKVHVVFDPDAIKKSRELASVLCTCGLNAVSVALVHGDPNEAPEKLEEAFSSKSQLRDRLARARF